MTGLKRRAGTHGAEYRLFLLFPFVTDDGGTGRSWQQEQDCPNSLE